MAYLAINGYPLPPSKRGIEVVVATVVDGGRDANGVTVGQKIGRDQYKVNNLEWAWLSADVWSRILSSLNHFYVNVSFYDPVTNAPRTIKMYPGDRSGEPYWVDKNGKPLWYTNCKFNLVDTGE